MNLKDLKVRLMTSVCVGVLCVLALLATLRPLSSFFFLLFVAAVALIALYEYFKLLAKKKLTPPIKTALFFSALYLLFSWLLAPPFPVVALMLAIFSFFLIFGLSQKNPLLHIGTSFFGMVYIIIPFGYVLKIPSLFHDGMEGLFWLGFLLAVTKSADMGGYFFGRILGRHKLALSLSPNKTLEGALGGLLSSLLVSLLFYWIARETFQVHLSMLSYSLLGLSLGFVGQLGDLAESLLKRDADVKDSNAIPGVGGLLDMVDSLLFSVPLLYFFLTTYLRIHP